MGEGCPNLVAKLEAVAREREFVLVAPYHDSDVAHVPRHATS